MVKARIGLIGAGWIGTEHARNLAANPRAELVALAAKDRTNAEKVRAAYCPNADIVDDYRRVLERADVDAVYICTPNAMHAEMSIAAALAGKHIMCEKPMAITLEDCVRIRDAVKKAGVRYLIGYQLRFNPLYSHVKSLLDSGQLGKPVFIESDYIHHVPADWKIWDWLGREAIAGSIFHAGSGHNADLLRFFCGEVTEVACYKDIAMPRSTQIETEDVAVAILRFASGAIGKILMLVGGVTPYTFNFALYGTRGTVRNNRIWFNTIPRFDQPGHENDCIELPSAWVPDNVPGSVSEAWGAQDERFVEMVINQLDSPNDVESAYRTSRVCFAALEAARSGHPVKLD